MLAIIGGFGMRYLSRPAVLLSVIALFFAIGTLDSSGAAAFGEFR
jgi:hypothetical protein